MARRDRDEFLESFRALTRCVRSVAAEAYASFEVGSTQAKFLRYIGEHSPISQADLARGTITDPALTGRALETLVERGWIRRKRSEDDRRQYVLELSAAGQRVRKRVDQARDEIAARLAAVLDERDMDDFARIARKLITAFGGSPDGGAGS